jgi:hypothetical protein
MPASALLGTAVPMSGRSVLETIPANFHSAIRSGAIRFDLARYFDLAARRAIALGTPLYVPAGTYTMVTWAPPAGLTVLTDGRGTVFRQLDTRGRSQRFIEVAADRVRLWPGGAATVDGGMTARGANATGFNSGIRVHAGSRVRIASFECGDVYGRNLGGDVLETGCEADGFLGTCTIGNIYGDNVYRNVFSITGGAKGTVASVMQIGGCGFSTVCVEPDPGSAPVGSWTIGRIRGHRMTIAGDPAVPIQSVTVAELDLDYGRPSSSPPFDAGSVSERASPTLFQLGLRYRNVGQIRIDRARFANFPRAAVEDIGSGTKDPDSGSVSFGALEIVQCGAMTGYQVVTQKTRSLDVERLSAVSKSSPSIATFLGGQTMTTMRIAGGSVTGRVVSATPGDFEATDLAIDGAGERVFVGVRGNLKLNRTTSSDSAVLFEDCTGSIEVNNSSLQSVVISRGSARPRIRLSKIVGQAGN